MERAVSPYNRSHRILLWSLVVLLLPVAGFFFFISSTTEHIIETAIETKTTPNETHHTYEPFPVGVDPKNKSIEEHPLVDLYLEEELDTIARKPSGSKDDIVEKVVAKLTLMDWYQNLAAGASRILIIQPGERKEQVAMNFAKILKWDDDAKREFLTQVVSSDPVFLEGTFTPGTYVVAEGAMPNDVAPLIVDRFHSEILSRYQTDVAIKVPLHDTLTIASLLEREAHDFEDMRYIAGVIWNRLFIDMNLQIDATLQYAKGAQAKKTWWPKPLPSDKYIDSPYNTYQNEGLPPSPIANPSADAVLAALNPRETECLYYFHDDDSVFHCTKTYEEHVALLKKYYGRGK